MLHNDDAHPGSVAEEISEIMSEINKNNDSNNDSSNDLLHHVRKAKYFHCSPVSLIGILMPLGFSVLV